MFDISNLKHSSVAGQHFATFKQDAKSVLNLIKFSSSELIFFKTLTKASNHFQEHLSSITLETFNFFNLRLNCSKFCLATCNITPSSLKNEKKIVSKI